MEIFIISLVAFGTSLLTFFSGFGLATILTPVMMYFFPTEVAIGLTAIVHFLNNLFKLALVGKQADYEVVKRFGIPAIIAALAGAWVLTSIPNNHILFHLDIGGSVREVTLLKFVIALLLFIFAWIEFIPFLQKLHFPKNLLPLGGLLSGFFGGLSGNQGALRSAFLVHAGLTKEALIGTTVILSCLVDFTRLGVYSTHINLSTFTENTTLLISATIAAFAGAYLGNLWLKKVTLKFVQTTVAVAIMLLSIAFATGVL